MGIKSAFNKFCTFYKIRKIDEIILFLPLTAALVAGGGAAIGEALYEDANKNATQELMASYQQKISTVAGMETKVFKLQKAVELVEANALLDENKDAAKLKVQNAKTLIAIERENLRLGIEALSQEMVLDKNIPEKDFSGIAADFDKAVDTKLPEYLAKVKPLSLRECQGGTASAESVAQCTVADDKRTQTIFGGTAAAISLTVLLGLPFLRRKKEQE